MSAGEILLRCLRSSRVCWRIAIDTCSAQLWRHESEPAMINSRICSWRDAVASAEDSRLTAMQRIAVILLGAVAICVAATACSRSNYAAAPPATLSPISNAFRSLGKVALEKSRTADVNDIFVSQRGDIFVAHDAARQIARYDATGAFRNYIGVPGMKPGQLGIPVAMDEGRDGDLFVLDYRQARVHIFKPDGEFVRAISYGFLGVTAFDFVVDDDSIFICGFNRLVPQGNAGPPLIQRLDLAGRLIGAFYPLDSRFETLNMRVFAGGIVAKGPNHTLFTAQQVSEQAQQLAPDGRVIATIGRVAPFYRAPNALPHRPDRSPTKDEINTHLKSWTRIVSLVPVGSEFTIIAYEINDPSAKYALEVLDSSGKIVAGALGSQQRPITANSNGDVWFQDMSGSAPIIEKYTLQINGLNKVVPSEPLKRTASGGDPK